MDETLFLETVQHIGADNILGILFDNSAVRMFYENQKFNPDTMYIHDIQSLKLPEYDRAGNQYWVYKHISDIQGFVVRDEKIPFNAYDRHSLRG